MNTPPPNPSHTMSTKTGLLERIRTAQSIEELETLYKLSFAFREASNKTIRRWKSAFETRKATLLDSQP